MFDIPIVIFLFRRTDTLKRIFERLEYIQPRKVYLLADCGRNEEEKHETDYDKFISISKYVLPDNLFLQNHNTDSEYHQGFSKLRNSKTTYIETPSRFQEINHGIFIDIFPIDGVPENPIMKEILFTRSKIVKVLLCRNDLSYFHGKRKLIAKLICTLRLLFGFM